MKCVWTVPAAVYEHLITFDKIGKIPNNDFSNDPYLGVFKEQLIWLLEEGDYNPDCEMDKDLLAYIFIPLVQNSVEMFTATWNLHR